MHTALSLYLHFPWCAKKCPYCDFNSHSLKEDLPEQAYIQALLCDLEHNLPLINNRPISSIFMGGGTPSLFSPEALHKLLEQLAKYLNFKQDIEITLEANPGTVEQTRFKGYLVAGINRLSLGLQSLQDQKLKALGRIHDAQTACQAVYAAKTAGFSNINLDLMFGLPQQTLEDALFDLKTAIGLAPTHLSWYQLTLEPNTLFYHQPPTLPPDESIWEIQKQGQQLLAEHDYQQYEISAYAQIGKQCKHNRNYWEFGDYLGLGAGAHSKLSLDNGRVVRMVKPKHPKTYLMQPKTTETRYLTSQDLGFEYMLNILRLKQPVSWQHFEQLTLLSRNQFLKSIQLAQAKELLINHEDGFIVTELGWQFLNDLLELFLPTTPA